MIHPTIESFICSDVEQLMIPADDVASVISSHTLNHGLLVLSQVKYSMIPVLSPKSQLVGLISMPLIINAAVTLNSIDIERLDQLNIADVMRTDMKLIGLDTPFEFIFRELIDHNFVCVVDPDQGDKFIGLITRREILKRLNHFVHKVSNNPVITEQVEAMQQVLTR